MQKAHLYEAILLVNRGIDEAVHGLERLKRLKDSRLDPGYFEQRMVLFEEQRARLNAYLCNNIENGEDLDAARFEERYSVFRKAMLDEVQVYQDVQAVEEQRRSERKPPRIRFLTQEEQREWQRQYHQPPATTEGERS